MKQTQADTLIARQERMRSTSARDVLTNTCISFALVFSTASTIAAQRSLASGSSVASALTAGLKTGQRWGRVSAGFNGGRAAAQWQGAPAVACTIIGAAAGGAAGASSLSQIPQRAALFSSLALCVEHALPPAVERGRMFIDAELKARRELFARSTTHARPQLRGTAAAANEPPAPLKRLRRFVDGLNAELGHNV